MARNNKKAIFLTGLLVGFFLYKSPAQCIEKQEAFQPGEKLVYDAYYNWGFIWIRVGEAVFEVNESKKGNVEMLELKGYGGSHKNYDWIFKVREDFTVLWNKNSLRPEYFERKSNEGGFLVDNKYTYNYDNMKVYTEVESSERPFTKDTLDLVACTWDVLSAIFYARTLDFTPYEPNTKIPIAILLDNNIHDLYIRFMGKENLKLRSKQEFETISFRPLLVKGTIFRGGEDMTVWVTDDRNKIPLMVEAKILVGSVKAILKNYEGLRNPVEAEVEGK